MGISNAPRSRTAPETAAHRAAYPLAAYGKRALPPQHGFRVWAPATARARDRRLSRASRGHGRGRGIRWGGQIPAAAGRIGRARRFGMAPASSQPAREASHRQRSPPGPGPGPGALQRLSSALPGSLAPSRGSGGSPGPPGATRRPPEPYGARARARAAHQGQGSAPRERAGRHLPRLAVPAIPGATGGASAALGGLQGLPGGSAGLQGL